MKRLKNKAQGRRAAALARDIALAAATLAGLGPVHAGAAETSYPNRAPLEQYLMASADEIALARSAAPASISRDAQILTLGAHGYEVAIKGKNGFVCLVYRAWASSFQDPGFWNPKQRAPICLNAPAVRSVLPTDLRRAEWALAGVSKAEMIDRTKASIAAHQIGPPELGAMSYMMSKEGYLNDRDGHWHPHLMFYLPRTAIAEWGANLPGGAVMGDDSSLEPITVFFVPVPHWSDGTPEGMPM